MMHCTVIKHEIKSVSQKIEWWCQGWYNLIETLLDLVQVTI